jgi:hypothetical protein
MNNIVKVSLVFCSILLVSCVDCEALEKAYRKDECILVVEKVPTKYESFFNFKGRVPITNKKCDCKGENSSRWWNLYKDKIKVGDTIIKKKGELTFSIHKKDTLLSFDFECQGKSYK